MFPELDPRFGKCLSIVFEGKQLANAESSTIFMHENQLVQLAMQLQNAVRGRGSHPNEEIVESGGP